MKMLNFLTPKLKYSSNQFLHLRQLAFHSPCKVPLFDQNILHITTCSS
uniref:Uncharacterized protein n=1 Tax=Anguilla anguilla TaxID=7936 RepID=A0A0E9TU05_ANGAN